MRGFTRVMLIISGVTIGLGLIIAVAGLSLGGMEAVRAMNMEEYGRWNRFAHIWNNDSDFEADFASFETENVDNNFAGISNLNINVNCAYMYLIEREGQSGIEVSAKNVTSRYKAYLEEEDTLAIDYDENYKQADDFNFLGVSAGSYGEKRPEIYIYIPEGTQFLETNIWIGAGSFEAENLSTDQLTVDVGVGRFYGNHIEVSDKTNASVDLGELKFDNFEGNEVVLECNLGSVNMTGKVAGNANVNCDLGSVCLKLDGEPEDYGYIIECDLGNVEVNGHNYRGGTSTSFTDSDLGKRMELYCNLGNIKVDFN